MNKYITTLIGRGRSLEDAIMRAEKELNDWYKDAEEYPVEVLNITTQTLWDSELVIEFIHLISILYVEKDK